MNKIKEILLNILYSIIGQPEEKVTTMPMHVRDVIDDMVLFDYYEAVNSGAAVPGGSLGLTGDITIQSVTKREPQTGEFPIFDIAYTMVE